MTQQILNMKPLGWKSLKGTPSGVLLRILRGQRNLLRML